MALQTAPLPGLIGSGRAMHHICSQINAAAHSDAPVLILGETGTGKDLCARLIHDNSARRKNPMIAMNTAALPRDLMEDELFGHARGAFTGAQQDRAGAAAAAHNGTLFLDEIGEMDLGLQAKLLRFLQDGSYRALGDTAERRADCRIICATNRSEDDLVRHGYLRPDLYYRLGVVTITLPPLRQRSEDIPELATHFLASYARQEKKAFQAIAPEAMHQLQNFDWPGNIRQLQNAIRHAVIFHSGAMLTPSMLPQAIRTHVAVQQARDGLTIPAQKPVWVRGHVANDPSQIRPLADIERETIESAIRACDGNIQQAAALLDIAPSTIYRKKMGW